MGYFAFLGVLWCWGCGSALIYMGLVRCFCLVWDCDVGAFGVFVLVLWWILVCGFGLVVIVLEFSLLL